MARGAGSGPKATIVELRARVKKYSTSPPPHAFFLPFTPLLAPFQTDTYLGVGVQVTDRHGDGAHIQEALHTLHSNDFREAASTKSLARLLHLFDARRKRAESTACIFKKEKDHLVIDGRSLIT